MSVWTTGIAGWLRAIAAVAALSIRAAVRSRVILALLALLGAAVLGLPRAIAGDGTPGSDVQVRLRYTLMAGAAILGLATLWGSCAGFGMEIGSRRHELAAVKPAHPAALWLGRWCGIVLLDAVLLPLMAAGVWAQLTPEQRASVPGRQVVHPLLKPVAAEAAEALERLRSEGRLPPEADEREVLRQLTINMRSRYTAIQPGGLPVWRFHPRQPLPADGLVWVRVRFDSDAEALSDARGVFRLRRAGAPAWAGEVALNELTRSECELTCRLPALGHAADLELGFDYQGKPDAPPLLVQVRRSLVLLAPADSLAMNLGRAVLALLAILAALAALGVTLGACFSFPVAAFTASAMLIAVTIGANLADDAAPASEATGWRHGLDRVSLAILHGIQKPVQPLTQVAPLAQAAAGERAADGALRRLCLSGFAVYPIVLMALASCVLRRREFPG